MCHSAGKVSVNYTDGDQSPTLTAVLMTDNTHNSIRSYSNRDFSSEKCLRQLCVCVCVMVRRSMCRTQEQVCTLHHQLLFVCFAVFQTDSLFSSFICFVLIRSASSRVDAFVISFALVLITARVQMSEWLGSESVQRCSTLTRCFLTLQGYWNKAVTLSWGRFTFIHLADAFI